MINNNFTPMQPLTTGSSTKDTIKQSAETKSAQEARRLATRAADAKDPYKVDVAKEMSYSPTPIAGVLTPSPDVVTKLASNLHSTARAIVEEGSAFNMFAIPDSFTAEHASSTGSGRELNAFVQILLFIAVSLGKFYGVSAQAAQETAELTAKQFQLQNISLGAQLDSAKFARDKKMEAAGKLIFQALMSAFSIVGSIGSAVTSARAAYAHSAQLKMDNLGSANLKANVHDAAKLSPELEGLKHLPKGEELDITKGLKDKLDVVKQRQLDHADKTGPHERRMMDKFNPVKVHDMRAADRVAYHVGKEKLQSPHLGEGDGEPLHGPRQLHELSAKDQVKADLKVTEAATKKLAELKKNPAAVDFGADKTTPEAADMLRGAKMVDAEGNLQTLAGKLPDGRRVFLSPLGEGTADNPVKVFKVTVTDEHGFPLDGKDKKVDDLFVTLKDEISDGKRLDALALKTAMPKLDYASADPAVGVLKGKIDSIQEPVGHATERVLMMKKAYDRGDENAKDAMGQSAPRVTAHGQSMKSMEANAAARMQYAGMVQSMAQALGNLTQAAHLTLEKEKEVAGAHGQLADSVTGMIGENWRNRTNANDAIIAAENKVTSEVLDGVAKALTGVLQTAAQAAQSPR